MLKLAESFATFGRMKIGDFKIFTKCTCLHFVKSL